MTPRDGGAVVQWHVLLVEVHTLQLYQLEEGTEGRLRVNVTCALQGAKSEWMDHTVGEKPLEADVFAQVHRGFVIPLKLPVDWYAPRLAPACQICLPRTAAAAAAAPCVPPVLRGRETQTAFSHPAPT